MVVVKNAADAAGFLAMRQVEIVIAPLLVPVVVGHAVGAAASRPHRRMKRDRVGVFLGPPPVEHRGQIRSAAKPCLRRHHEAGVHVHGRNVRVAHMRDHRNPRRPEPRIVGSAGNLRAKFGAEFAVHRRAMRADLLEQTSVHYRHHATAAGLAGMVGAVPWRARETPRGTRIERGRRIVLQSLEGRANIIAQGFEPGLCPRLAILDHGDVHRSS